MSKAQDKLNETRQKASEAPNMPGKSRPIKFKDIDMQGPKNKPEPKKDEPAKEKTKKDGPLHVTQHGGVFDQISRGLAEGLDQKAPIDGKAAIGKVSKAAVSGAKKTLDKARNAAAQKKASKAPREVDKPGRDR